jgi:hypothetical protein
VFLGLYFLQGAFSIMPQGLQTELDGVFLISLDDEGRCKSLREWWHKQQKRKRAWHLTGLAAINYG